MSKPHCLGMLLDGRAQESGVKRRGPDETLFVAMNACQGVGPFTLPPAAGGPRWTRLVEANRGGPALEHFEFGQRDELAGRSLVLFVLDESKALEESQRARD